MAVDYQPVREVRFAVVMYGGTSLAIYMNGIAQELLSVVRSTAPERSPTPTKTLLDDGALRGSSYVYRRMARGDGGAVNTRFVVDILSGTSAGGLNGLFLAKAIACELPDLKPLEDLWIREADLGKLINDKEGRKDLKGLPSETPPEALLSSHRMYAKLLEALHKMSSRSKAFDSSELDPALNPYVDELDLFMTATDLVGLNLPIELADGQVFERRHRAAFHFRLAKPGRQATHGISDFGFQNDPFLAFVARCTSCIVPAFKPMRLADVSGVLKAGSDINPGYPEDIEPYLRKEGWGRFFREYWSNTREGALDADEAVRDAKEAAALKDFLKRDFGDGGYLDQAPFTHATKRLSLRRADIPVERKLLYVEPRPAEMNDDRALEARKTVLEHAKAATSLAQADVIREDIERVRERNGMLERVERIFESFEKEGNSIGSAEEAEDIRSGGKNVSQRTYLQLRAESTTEDLAKCLCEAHGFEANSPYSEAIRILVTEWRKEKYSTSQSAVFLQNYDLGFRLRRINYLQRSIDKNIRKLKPNEPTNLVSNSATQAQEMQRWLKVKEYVNEVGAAHLAVRAVLASRSDSESALLNAQIKRVVSRLLGEETHSEKVDHPAPELRMRVSSELSKLGFTQKILGEIISPRDRDERARLAREFLFKVVSGNKTRIEVMDELVAALDSLLKLPAVLDENLRFWLFTNASPDIAELEVTFLSFEAYDASIFPIIFGTGAVEAGRVDILRVSPLDATALASKEEAVDKLAGKLVLHFGGFFHPEWRKDDIVWGKLDAAERIICSINTDDGEERRKFIAEAQLGILLESDIVNPRLRKLLIRRALGAHKFSATHNAESRRDLIDDASTTDLTAYVKKLDGKLHPTDYAKLAALTGQEDFLTFDPQPYTRAELPLTTQLNWIGRSLSVLDQVFEGLQAIPGSIKPHTKNIGFIGKAITGIALVSTPNTMGHAFWRHWFGLLLLFSSLLVVVGTLMVRAELATFGWLVLLVTLGIGAVVLSVRTMSAARLGPRSKSALTLFVGAGALLYLVSSITAIRHTLDTVPLVAILTKLALIAFLISACVIGIFGISMGWRGGPAGVMRTERDILGSLMYFCGAGLTALGALWIATAMFLGAPPGPDGKISNYFGTEWLLLALRDAASWNVNGIVIGTSLLASGCLATYFGAHLYRRRGLLQVQIQEGADQFVTSYSKKMYAQKMKVACAKARSEVDNLQKQLLRATKKLGKAEAAPASASFVREVPYRIYCINGHDSSAWQIVSSFKNAMRRPHFSTASEKHFMDNDARVLSGVVRIECSLVELREALKEVLQSVGELPPGTVLWIGNEIVWKPASGDSEANWRRSLSPGQLAMLRENPAGLDDVDRVPLLLQNG